MKFWRSCFSYKNFFKNFVVDSKGLFKCLGEATKNSNKVFSSEQILYINILFSKNLFIFQRLMKAIKYSKTLNFKKEFFWNLSPSLIYSLYFSLIYNFFYTQLSFAFHLLEDFYIVHKHMDVFCSFVLQKNAYIVQGNIFDFYFFFIWRIFTLLASLFFSFYLLFEKIWFNFFFISGLQFFHRL